MIDIEVDSVRRSDLSVLGWLGVGLTAAGLAYAGWTLITSMTVGGGVVDGLIVGVGAALIGGIVAYGNAIPEMDAMCDHCGDRIVAHSSRDGHDESIEVACSSDPRRGRLGPLSVVLQRRTDTYHYCSGECVAADVDRRRMQIPSRSETGSTAAARLAATDGGTDQTDGGQTDNQGVPQPETRGSDR
ncbi:hypothetical protein [Haloarcula sebkhae]|uniref:Uncharacterized protein n=2 Tax=Haloarcula sebkhae TaxID=932660 RepID=A0A830EYQ6_9EURY|nr:hypothetical protein [Haloarcula sebkhae]GGK64634.1 hypothetical protein GCM10009067_16370 [Haloarcula sebkhae]